MKQANGTVKSRQRQKDKTVFSPPNGTTEHFAGIYLIIALCMSISWVLGTLSFSFTWVFLLLGGLFLLWTTRFSNVVKSHLLWHEEHLFRKKALRHNETVEWLNFLINRWWVFSAASIEDLIKKKVNERLVTVKPHFLDALELMVFTFGDLTPTARSVKVLESPDGAKEFLPATWNSITNPPLGLDKMGAYRVLLEVDMTCNCDDFRMVFRGRVGNERVGLNFDAVVEQLQVTGRLQIILLFSMEVPFPHVSKATISFIERPDVWFNVRMLKALQIMEIPLVKSWIYINVLEGLTKALVDPGRIEVPIATVGAILADRPGYSRQKTPLAQGVITVLIKCTPPSEPGEEVRYTRLRLGKHKRQTMDVSAADEWSDICSFFVYNLAKDKIQVKSKCKRLLMTVTLEQHEIDLSSFPFEQTNLAIHEIQNQDGSKLQFHLQYTKLTPICLDQQQVDSIHGVTAGVVYVCVHGASNVLAGDIGGTSDPYCVVFCNRRRVLTTPYVPRTRNPIWESHVEFFVENLTEADLTFYVFDWDGTNIINDDFLGYTTFSLSEHNPTAVRVPLTLGYNKHTNGNTQNSTYGNITVSVVFRPVTSVAKSEKFRAPSSELCSAEVLYMEDLTSPGFKSSTNHHSITTQSEEGGRTKSKKSLRKKSVAAEYLEDKIYVELTVLQAKDLVAMDRNGFSDPYCQVMMNNKQLFCTSVKKKTLFPKWNESFMFEMKEDVGMIEIFLYDKDIISKDFLGKVTLTLEQMKELSHKGTSDWFTLQRTQSGQLQVRCSVTTKESVESITNPKKSKDASRQISHISDEVFRQDSIQTQTSQASDTVANSHSSPSQVPATTPSKSTGNSPIVLPASDVIKSETLPRALGVNASSPVNAKFDASPQNPSSSSQSTRNETGLDLTPAYLRHSTSDVSMERKKDHSNFDLLLLSPVNSGIKPSESINSFPAFHGGDTVSLSEVLKVPSRQSKTSKFRNLTLKPSPKGKQSFVTQERLYSVSGKILNILGLQNSQRTIYCKVRVQQPSSHKKRFTSNSRVIAKSPLVKASRPELDVPFEIDRGVGTSLDTMIIFDVKADNKEHIATKGFKLRCLFEGIAADRVQKWLPLENSVQVEVFLSHGKPDLRLLNRKSRTFKNWSFRKDKTYIS
ncbi:hypothetical protein CHS0354_041607 [Potamilus streckersoni]|uniref:Uncharacterized protein n=1 Tax=Potamilus streckersoni TaxID=2493646 RepID=A0AAE0SGE7_9BIVA|nr:hypothetical protein CHS0354_041607 [Potamilus streckersoni]